MRRGLARARRLCLAVFVVIFVFAQHFQRGERQLPTSLHDAKQLARLTLVVPAPSLVAGECQRRSDRCFVGWPVRTSNLPEFPTPAQQWRLLFVSAEILRSVFSGPAQDSLESPSG